MKIVCYTILICCGLILVSCNQSEQYTQKAKTLDSLSGALNQKIKELEKTDTAILQRCITRYNYYSQFIKQNVNDTLSKDEADNLQAFDASGKNLQSFASNRFIILARAALINSQQAKISEEIKNKSASIEQLTGYILREKEASAEIIEVAAEQQKAYYSSLEEFKISLKKVEELIRVRNKGQLPTIIKDTLAL